ncbi:MAG: ATP-binding protein [Pseudomonadota bacterium]
MQSQSQHVRADTAHYLEKELEGLVNDKRIWYFLRAGSLDGIWYWDLENPEHEWMSPEFWELLGLDPSKQAHSPQAWQDLIHPEDLKVATANFQKHCEDPSHPYDQLVRYKHADGSTVWVRCRGFAIRSENGTPIRMLGAHNDVTSLKAAEQMADAEFAQAQRADEQLRTFAYSTSHDLKSPANTIRMLLQEARRALQSGDQADAHQMIEKAESTNEAMRVMVDKLLEYTRTMGAEDEHTQIDLDRLIADVIESIAFDIKQSGARVSVDTLGVVTGSHWQIRQMFQNLITNAIKFRLAGHTPDIEIRSVPAGPGRLGLEIADDGIGIAPEDRGRIFSLFTKLHRPSEYAGSGVGLAFCERVARIHGSRISVRSELGEGTTFQLDLPL